MTAVSDPAIFANGVDTGVLSGVGNGIVVTLTEPGSGDISDYIYSFGAAGTAPHIWFLSDTQSKASLPPQLQNITLTTTSMVETGSVQDLSNVFGTPFRVISDLDPVPEPAAWAMMILGFGMAGAVLRRQRSGLASNVQ
ncbi:MAG TPA: PEPxxWA-CTERM sorting domain-containing protein [Phenylobacterium sp.]